MTYLFSSVPAGLARFCAARPIHFIVATVLLAMVAYNSLLETYMASTLQSADTRVSFYHDSNRYTQWKPANEGQDAANHLYLTPLRFRGGDAHDYPSMDAFIASPVDPAEKFFPASSVDVELPLVLESKGGVHFKLRSGSKIGKYFEFFKFVLLRFKNLVLGADTFDIILMTLGYFAMMFTFVTLFVDMRKLGSSFWLFFGSILSSAFAFLFALAATTEVLGIKVPLVSLSEGLPFLVATIGFRHKVAFTTPVINALNSNTKKSISEVVYETVKSKTALPLIRDQLIISTSFILCSLVTINLPGLKNFCVLSAIILGVDLFFTFTFYAAIISLKAQITKVHKEVEFRQVLEEDGLSPNLASEVVKTTESLADSKVIFKQGNGIVYFKVFMVAGFLGLHIFFLGTSWLFDDSEDLKPLANDAHSIQVIKDVLAKLDTTNDTLVTLLPSKLYREVTPLTEIEYYIYRFFSTVFSAITDPLVSKFLMFITGISLAMNIYLLNVARDHLFGKTKHVIAPETHAVVAEVKKTKKKSRAKSAPVVVEEPAPASAPSPTAENIKVGQLVEDTSAETSSNESDVALTSTEVRPMEELVEIMKAGNVKECNNSEICELATSGKLPLYALEKQLGDKTRAVLIRRLAIAHMADAPVLLTEKLPYKHYDYERVFGACCENVIGYLPLPIGVAGPIIIDGVPFHIPVATTEGCLVASTMRGCKAINAGSGVETVLTADGMTRGPCVQFPNLKRAGAAKIWLDSTEGQNKMKEAFNSTSRFARLQHIKTAMAGHSLYIRFKTTTGDAMGMNMISKGVEHALTCMVEKFGFDDMKVVSISGNYCIDKKAAAINWIDGRGKSIVASADIPADVVQKVLKSDVDALVELNVSKNLVGSAMAGSIGGFNAHAANLLTAVFLATGQDPAQNVESSNCITLMDKLPNGDLRISVSMPSIEVGTIGGGTVLDPQNAMLELLNVKGPHPTEPGANARQLAKVVASAVLAAELSLCSALAAGHLVQSHMQHNRKAPAAPAAPVVSPEDVQRLTDGSKICIKS